MKSLIIGLVAGALASSFTYLVTRATQADPALVASLAADVIRLNAEMQEMEARLDSLPDCFQLLPEGTGW